MDIIPAGHQGPAADKISPSMEIMVGARASIHATPTILATTTTTILAITPPTTPAIGPAIENHVQATRLIPHR
jgi:hypothetical protein